MITRLIAVALLATYATAIPIDNGVEGDPEIECGPTSITINFNTQNNFEGHVYVKGLYDQDGCRTSEGGRQVAGIELPFETCNVARTRSLNPKGVFVTTTVVISFHPQFITKIDRAYRIQCFYMEADKTVSTELEVSMLTTGFQTQLVPMPICRYEILEGGPTGQPVKFVLVGDQVYHKWTCDTETVDTFCMIVHSCFVDDGNGERVDLLDQDGCAVDRFLLNNLEYPTDLMAGQEAHVFKYADRPQLFFQCQITITIKEPNEECPRPQCSEPQGFATAGSNFASGVRTAAVRPIRPRPRVSGARNRQVQRPPAPRPPIVQEQGGPPAAVPPPPAPVVNIAQAGPPPQQVQSGSVGPAPAPVHAGVDAFDNGAPESSRPDGGERDEGAWAGHDSLEQEEPPASQTEEDVDPFGFAKRFRLLRKKRSAPKWERNNAGIMDVRAEVSALDIEDRQARLPSNLQEANNRRRPFVFNEPAASQGGLCFSFVGFSALVAVGVSLIVAILVVSCTLHSNTKRLEGQ